MKNKLKKLYLAAIEEVEKLEDYQLAHLIYVELGEFYVFRELYEDAFKNFEKALNEFSNSILLHYLLSDSFLLFKSTF